MVTALRVDDTIARLEIEARADKHAREVLADLHEDRGEARRAQFWRDCLRDDVYRLHFDELPEKSFKTRKRVNTMNDAESAQMSGWAKKWIEIGLCTERADRPLFEAAVKACYRYTKLPEPTVVWAPCPIVVAYAGPIAAWWCDRLSSDSVHVSVHASVHDSVDDSVGASVGDSVHASVAASVGDSVHASVDDSVDASVHDSVRDSVDASVHDSVRDSVDASVGDSVHASVHASVGDSVGDSVAASVHDSVHASVHDSVGASVHASVHDSVGDSVHASVDDSVGDSVAASVHDSVHARSRTGIAKTLKQQINNRWHHRFGGQFWSGWGYYWRWGGPSSITFALDVLRLDIGREQELKARAYAATHMSACWWWPSRSFVIVSERPSVIEKYENGKLKLAQWDWTDGLGEKQSWAVRG